VYPEGAREEHDLAMDIYQLKGCGTALVTPFDATGAGVDEAALRGDRMGY